MSITDEQIKAIKDTARGAHIRMRKEGYAEALDDVTNAVSALKKETPLDTQKHAYQRVLGTLQTLRKQSNETVE